MEKQYNPSEIEKKHSKNWQEQNSFSINNHKNAKDSFCIALPPPNVTGSLHMGHAFQHTIMDVLIRYNRMQHKQTHWQAGTDHAGIATQMVVKRQLDAENTYTNNLNREEFIEKVWQWKKHSGGLITSQMRRLGSSIDWQKECFTMDNRLSKSVITAFVKLYEQGLIYRGKRLVNWDPVLKTALSDLEVVSKEENGTMYYVRYPFVDDSGYMEIATTRPETILVDGALAVNPADNRYKKMLGKKVYVPLTERKIPIICDDYVDMNFGSGCVKITPAHDFKDWEVGKRHNIVTINLFTKDAKLNENAPKKYQSLDRFVARKNIVQDLDSAGFLVKEQKHKHLPPRGDRSNAILEPLLTDQWFVKTDVLAKEAIEVVKNGSIRFTPDNWQKTYFNWLENIQDWCISRQIWWGHRIPAWYDKDGNIYVAHSQENAQKQAGDGVLLMQDKDVLDTWFSSALWPFSTLGWPENTNDLERFFPTNVLVTAFDIIFFWVARMIMFSLYFTKKIPFKNIYITGLILDSQGNKMSKSKGNVIDPLDIIDGIDLENLVKKNTANLMQANLTEKIAKDTKKNYPNGIDSFGADALRFNFCALATFGRSINFDLNRIRGYRNFCNKLWNASRFVLIQCEQNNIDSTNISIWDEWLISKLNKCIKNTKKNIKLYRFDLISKNLYEFVWFYYCDWYLEVVKINAQKNIPITLINTLSNILHLLHPIIPFITEEIFQKCHKLFNTSQNSLVLAPYPQYDDDKINDKTEQIIHNIQQIILSIRSIRSQMNISPATFLECYITENDDKKLINSNKDTICKLAKLKNISYISDNEFIDKACAFGICGKLRIYIILDGVIDIQKEINRLNKTITKLKIQIKNCSNRLNNKEFKSKATTNIYEEVLKNFKNHNYQLDILKKQKIMLKK